MARTNDPEPFVVHIDEIRPLSIFIAHKIATMEHGGVTRDLLVAGATLIVYGDHASGQPGARVDLTPLASRMFERATGLLVGETSDPEPTPKGDAPDG